MLALLCVLAARAAAAPAYDEVPMDDDSGPDVLDSGAEPAPPPDVANPGDADAGSEASSATSARGRAPGASARGPAGAPPDVREVIAAATRAAGLAGDPARGWRHRARLAALVPSLSVRGGRDDTWRDVADPTLGHSLTFGVTASWRFDHLVFEPTELRIATVDVLRRRERRRLTWYVISLYRAWRRTGNDDLAAQLDVVTDGWFSKRLSRST